MAGLANTAEMEARLAATKITRAAAKAWLEVMIADKGKKQVALPAWAKGLWEWANRFCKDKDGNWLSPSDCATKYMESLGIGKNSERWKEFFSDLVKALSRAPEKWQKSIMGEVGSAEDAGSISDATGEDGSCGQGV